MNNLILMIAGVSVIVGIFCGVLIVCWIYFQRRHLVVDSLVRSNHVVGCFGTVEIPFDCSSLGKVRVNVKGCLVDFVALTDGDEEFCRGDRVFVVGVKGSKVWVMSEGSVH